MSYAYKPCRTSFSDLQISRIKDFINNTTILQNTFHSVISGPSTVCSSGNTFTITNPPPVDSIVWECGPNLTITSGQNTDSCTFSANGIVNSWVRATLVNNCGSITLPQKNVTGGLTASFTGNSSVDYRGRGTWNATASGCSAPYHYQWWLREETNPPVGAVLVGESPSLILSSNPRSALAANTELSSSGTMLPQPSKSTKYYLRLEAYDAGGMRFDTQERLIIAYGNVNLVSPLRMAGNEVEQVSALQMAISPNPATDESTVEIISKEFQTLESTEWQVELYDASQILKTKIQKIKGNRQTIRTSGWKEGVYIVRARVGNEVLTDKLVIKH